MIDGIYILGIIFITFIPAIICCVQHLNEIDKPIQDIKYSRV